MNYVFLLLTASFLLPLTAKAELSTGQIVYFENQGGASSSRAPADGNWIGEVTQVLKGDLVEVKPTFHNGIEYSGPHVFRPAYELVPSVKEKNGFTTRDSVTLKNKDEKGSVILLFSNGQAFVDWSVDWSQVNSSIVNTDNLRLLTDRIKGVFGLEIGNRVFVNVPIQDFDLRDNTLIGTSKIRGKSKYPNSHLVLGHLPYTGIISEFSEQEARSPAERLVTIQVEKKNGAPVKGENTIQVQAKGIAVELPHASGDSLKAGDSVTYQSDRGRKPYEFKGTVERVFTGGILEIRWQRKNGKEYGNKTLSYLPIGAVRRSEINEGARAAGIPVLRSDPASYLAIASVERALKSPDASYLNELDRLAYDRANKVCVAKGLKGLLARPQVLPWTEGKNKILYTINSQNQFEVIRDLPVEPWAFGHVRVKKSPLMRLTILTGTSSVLVGELMTVFGAAGVAAGGGVGIVASGGGLAAVPIVAWGGYAAYRHSKTTPLEEAKVHQASGKKIHKKFEMFSKKVSTLVFSELLCTNDPGQVLNAGSSQQFIDLNIPASYEEIIAAVAEAGPSLAAAYQESSEESDSNEDSGDLPPSYEHRKDAH